jgi:Domain of unknown function (DUF4062)
VRVFISSVTARLRDARDGLAAVLAVVDPFVPLRFEDFVAPDRAPRVACLEAVRQCDVYVLLLGPTYGEPWPDSGLAPTEEEFQLARRLGKPTLVFVLSTDERDEPAQADFKARVEHYVNGRFRASFTDTQSLNVAVLAALREVQVDAAPLRWQHLAEAAPILWRWEVPAVHDRAVAAPVLDVHLIPLGTGPLLASRLGSLPTVLLRAARDAGFLDEQGSVVSGSDRTSAWAWASDAPSRGTGFAERRVHEHRGVAVHANGQVTAFEALPTDFAGALVDLADLRTRLVRLLAVAVPQLPLGAERVAVAASLAPADRVFEGDPAGVTGRTHGHMRMAQGFGLSAEPNKAVTADALRVHAPEIADELASELLLALRDAPR